MTAFSSALRSLREPAEVDSFEIEKIENEIATDPSA